MARPKKPPRDASQQQTPFGRVLIDYMWNQRDPMEPPLTTGQLAVRVGVQRSTISNWISGRFVPPLDTVFEVLARLHIPLQRLADAYRELGMQTPELLQPDTGPQPRSFIPPSAGQRAGATSARDEWDDMINRTVSALRDTGLDPDTIAAVIEHIRDRQANRQPYQQHILAEHTQPYGPATGATTSATTGSTDADDPSAAERPESHERRGPRRRTPSSP